MGIDINRLGPAAQKQALQKLLQQKAVKQSKYHNEKATRTMPNGEIRTFDSLREARRYDHLRMLYEAGAIQDLRLQQTFTLQEGYVAADGEIVRPITYKADFVYSQDGKPVIEDVKGVRTDKYRMKYKMMLEHGYKITEV